ncbi:MAG: hypothetical protein NC905_07720 [Candidatus Omnitrophica bacterium]|nr:hypothetical protein [Candidatus Omnitrophota bacterium]MCM8778124.1 hypothetical protein [Candidatus Omnitrophota bacterium]
MENEIKRYRVRPKRYLCLSPEEAVSTGITIGEETVEELLLIKGLLFGSLLYASIREIDEYELMKIPVEERKERLFDSRKEAARYISENNTDGTLVLYGVKEIKSISRENIGTFESTGTSQVLNELKKFEKTG